MAKRKAEIKGRLYTQKKTVTTIDKKQIQLYIQHKKFSRSLFIKPGMTSEEIEKIVDRAVRPEFEKFFKKNHRKGRGDKYIFTMMTNMNFGGKRVKTGFSTRRKKITKAQHFEMAMHDLKHSTLKGFLKKIMQYLARQGLKSYSIRGVKMEVTTNDDTSKRQRKKKKAKTKSRAASRSKRKGN